MIQPFLYVRSRGVSIVVLVGQTKIPFVINQKLSLTKEYHQIVKDKCNKNTLWPNVHEFALKRGLHSKQINLSPLRSAYIYACLYIYQHMYNFLGINCCMLCMQSHQSKSKTTKISTYYHCQ